MVWEFHQEQAIGYNERVERGHYLVIVDGTDAEIAKAKAILLRWGIEEFGIYDYPNGKHETTDYVSTTPPTSAIPYRGVNLTKHAIGYFSKIGDAEAAIHYLYTIGFPLSQISLICRDFSQLEQSMGVTVSDRFDAMRLGLPDERARFYNDQINQGYYAVIVSGTDNQLHHVSSPLAWHGIQELQIYDPMLIRSTSPNNAAVPVAHSTATSA
ncbi:hypothetical protein NUACC21_39720 [Scytonema sp. NUACC21]